MVFKTVILGIIEGLTEFIPISSTGHLILAGHLLEFPQHFGATFEIAIQSGAILAAVLIYWPFFSNFLKPSHWISKDAKLVVISCAPAALVGLFLHSLIKTYLFTPLSVGVAFIVGGILLVVMDKQAGDQPEIPVSQMTYWQALTIGLVQCASLWPGMSRSGSAIAGGLLAKVGRQSSAKYSFIIAVPLIIAASIFDISTSGMSLSRYEIMMIVIGFVTSFIVAVASIKLFLGILSRFKLAPFAYYRIVIGSCIIALEYL